MAVYFIVIAVAILALVVVAVFYQNTKGIPDADGSEEYTKMNNMSLIIRGGAKTFMKLEYRRIVPIVAVIAIIFTLFVEKTSGIAFIIGATASTIACITGMRGATYANLKVAYTALKTKSIGKTTKTALIGGAISGLCVMAMGVIGVIAVLLIWGNLDPSATGSALVLKISCNPFVTRLTACQLGYSIIAMFNRVAGGNFTKAADISADLVGKNEFGLAEDDERIPNVMADMVGDNVNDIAGNLSDLCESFVATVTSSIVIAGTVFSKACVNGAAGATQANLDATMFFPVALAGAGLFSCIIAILIVTIKKMGNNPSKELNFATYLSAGITAIAALGLSYYYFGSTEVYSDFRYGWISPFISVLIGLITGVAVGLITEYYTSADFKPTRMLAEIAPEGASFLVTKGDALGSKSVLPITTLIAVATVVSYAICGFYGLAISALGMLSFVATTVSIDAFGPISDNAGGIAEACNLPEAVRAITDKLDSVGNMTAAVGKGFAIGSAALATVSLITAYIGNGAPANAELILNMARPVTIAGAIVGVGLIEFFSSKILDDIIDAATKMADEGRRQLKHIMSTGADHQDPDYNKCIGIATNEALNRMIFPSVVALLVPVVCGLSLGFDFVGGILIGSTLAAIAKAIFMGNSGGAFDNAKKYIEAGLLKGFGKGSEAHKAAVIGDTIGDGRKDGVGVDQDIFIKMMATVANTIAPIILAYALFG